MDEGVGRLDEQPAHLAVALLGDPELRVALARLVFGRCQPEVGADPGRSVGASPAGATVSVFGTVTMVPGR